MSPEARRGCSIACVIGLVVLGVIVIDAVFGGTGNPREVLGRTPEEWRRVPASLIPWVILGGIFASWVGGYWFIHALKRPTTEHPRCTACRYSLKGLPEGSGCPECGGLERMLDEPIDWDARLTWLIGIWALGAAALSLTLLAIGDNRAMLVIHIASTLPVILIAADRRLANGEARFIMAIILAAVSAMIAWGVRDMTQSKDALATFGMMYIGCVSLAAAGPAYFLGGLAIFLWRLRQWRRLQ